MTRRQRLFSQEMPAHPWYYLSNLFFCLYLNCTIVVYRRISTIRLHVTSIDWQWNNPVHSRFHTRVRWHQTSKSDVNFVVFLFRAEPGLLHSFFRFVHGCGLVVITWDPPTDKRNSHLNILWVLNINMYLNKPVQWNGGAPSTGLISGRRASLHRRVHDGEFMQTYTVVFTYFSRCSLHCCLRKRRLERY